MKPSTFPPKLVGIRSVNGTAGEREVAEFILRWLRSFPYFAAHSERAFAQEIPGDTLGRENVFAYVHGTKKAEGPRKTLVWHGHIDTVGTEDFGTLEPWANDPDKLLEKLLAEPDLPAAVRSDLATGDWMPGRGACDMKSGDAVFLVLLTYLSEHTDAFSGTIVLSLNCVEENEHTGILHGLDVLDELKEREGLDYLFAINNDYICPLYDGDPHRYLYTGAVGKLLPCVYMMRASRPPRSCGASTIIRSSATAIAASTRCRRPC